MFAISRIESYKFSSCLCVFNEAERKLAGYRNPHWNPSKTVENVQLVRPPFVFVDKYILKRKEELKCRLCIDPKAAKDRQTNVMCQALFGASPEFFEGMLKADIVEYFVFCLDFFKDKFPTVEILSAVVHFDESTPHMHVSFLPLAKKRSSRGVEKTVFSTSELFRGRDFFATYQEDFFKHISSLYPEKSIERKGDIHQSHMTVHEYKKKQREIEELDKVLSSLHEEVESKPGLALQIENAELKRELSKYQRFVNFILEKVPQLGKVFKAFQEGKNERFR